MILGHDHYRLGWGWDEIVFSFLGLPIAFFGYGTLFALLYLFFILNALVRKIRGTDRIELMEFRKKLMEKAHVLD